MHVLSKTVSEKKKITNWYLCVIPFYLEIYPFLGLLTYWSMGGNALICDHDLRILVLILSLPSWSADFAIFPLNKHIVVFISRKIPIEFTYYFFLWGQNSGPWAVCHTPLWACQLWKASSRESLWSKGVWDQGRGHRAKVGNWSWDQGSSEKGAVLILASLIETGSKIPTMSPRTCLAVTPAPTPLTAALT